MCFKLAPTGLHYWWKVGEVKEQYRCNDYKMISITITKDIIITIFYKDNDINDEFVH